MNELVKIRTVNGESAVNARELHEALNSKARFTDWISYRIDQYGFVENVDYQILSEISVKPQGGRPSIEYTLTLDMAKELAMVENNEQGRRVRRYFIEVENRMRKGQMLDTLNIPSHLVDGAIYYWYDQVVEACGLSMSSSARAKRRRLHAREFVCFDGVWLVSLHMAHYMYQLSKARKLRTEIAERRLEAGSSQQAIRN
jgi:phage anti-repressor protein